MFYLELFRALEKFDVRYLLVGGVAVNLHGIERMTMDVDLMVALDAENLDHFVAAAEALGLKPTVPVSIRDLGDPVKVRSWIEEKRALVLSLRPPAASDPTVDILLVTPVAFGEAYPLRVRKRIEGIVVSLASIPHLIALKRGTGRARDESDILALTKLAAMQTSSSDET